MAALPKSGQPNIIGYTKPFRLSPQWEVGYLNFQGGAAHLRTGSLTGGGQQYAHGYVATFQPIIARYATRTQSLTGSGQALARPGFLARLFGGAAGQGS